METGVDPLAFLEVNLNRSRRIEIVRILGIINLAPSTNVSSGNLAPLASNTPSLQRLNGFFDIVIRYYKFPTRKERRATISSPT